MAKRPQQRKPKPKAKPVCYFCHKEQEDDDALCFGCGEIVCENCDRPGGVMGRGHHPEAHQEPDGND